jgi:uncharacterized membrane protein
MAVLEIISQVIGGIGIGIVVWGTFRGFVEFLISELRVLRKPGENVVPFQKISTTVGSYLLLGLEFLVASDIIDTVIKPTLEDAAMLLIIVAIRVILNYFLSREMAHYKADQAEKTQN